MLLFILELSGQEFLGFSNNWYFGNRAAISFNTDPPTALADSPLNTQEGVATISDFEGQLLFYTDGITVWDRNNIPMPNGNASLLGNFSSTQSGVIVPNLMDPNLYYLFTTDELAGANGLSYSVIDLNLQGNGSAANPMGDVVLSERNIQLATPVTEKITAIVKSDNLGYWLIAHGWNNNDFLVFEVTCDGVNETPVISSVGPEHGGDMINAVGYLKATLGGEMLGVTNRLDNSVGLYDFDTETGVVSNYQRIVTPSTSLYGLEFSPSTEFLYIAGLDEIYQYNLSTQQQQSIPITGQAILNSNNVFRALQLGPDNRIYVSVRDLSYLSFIENSDESNASVTIEGIFLDIDNSGRACDFGLPNVFFFDQNPMNIVTASSCEGVPFIFNNEPFDPGDVYEVNLVSVDGCDSTIILDVALLENSSLDTQLSTCNNEPVTYNGEQLQGGTTTMFTFTNSIGCDSIETVTVLNENSIELQISESICSGESITINGENFSQGGSFTQILDNPNGCDTILSILIEENSNVVNSLFFELCENESIEINGVNFQAGQSEDFILQSASGCDSILTVMTSLVESVVTDLNEIICEGEQFILNNQTFDTEGTFTEIIPSSNGCDSIVILDLEVQPSLMSTQSIELCDGDTFQFGNETINTGGQFAQSFTSNTGCDSIVTLNVEVISPMNEERDFSFCEDDGIEINGIFFTESGTFIQDIIDDNGCQAELILNLTGQQCSECFPSILSNKISIQIYKNNHDSYKVEFSNEMFGTVSQVINSEKIPDILLLYTAITQNKLKENHESLIKKYIEKGILPSLTKKQSTALQYHMDSKFKHILSMKLNSSYRLF